MPVERFPVEAGHIMLFARAIGDENLIYSDAEYAKTTDVGQIIAPPTFAQAGAQFDPDAGLRWRPNRPWFGSGREPTSITPDQTGDGGGGGGGRGLHAEQHFEYHRHLHPGDVLTSSVRQGKSWEREGRRAGKLQFSETITEYHDQHGNLVITTRSVGVQTERVAD